jgi:hypothetical protein
MGLVRKHSINVSGLLRDVTVVASPATMTFIGVAMIRFSFWSHVESRDFVSILVEIKHQSSGSESA